MRFQAATVLPVTDDRPVTDDMDVMAVQLAVPDGEIHLSVTGHGPPLILLHGWSLDARMWQPQIAGLARDFRLIMPDRRGFGRSSAPPDLMRETDDLARIADHLGLDRFSLLGLSQGAALALAYANHAPLRLAAIIASGAPLPLLVPRGEVLDLELYQTMAQRGEMAAMRSDWAKHPLMQARTPTARLRLQGLLANYDGRDLLAPSSLPDLAPAAIAALPMPLLAITGDGDTAWRKACAIALSHTAKHGAFALIDNAGHVANLDNPASFNRLIADFLNASVPASAQQGTMP